MISKIDICNMALAQLGQEPIASLDQDDERARRCRLFYEPVKQEVLRTHHWAFARGVADLALLDTDFDARWPYVYAYPADCLFLRKVFGSGQNKEAQGFEEFYRQDIQARVIGCAVSKAKAEYTRNVQDSSLFDPAFVKAFSLALAADLAMALSADAALAQRILQKYTLALDEARRSNMTENWDIHRASSVFVEHR